MRLDNSAHTSRPWRIHEVAPDFRVEDVWALPTPGGPDDFHLLVEDFAKADTDESSSRRRPAPVRAPLEARGAVRLGRRQWRDRLTSADAPRSPAR